MNWRISLGSFAGIQLYAHWTLALAPLYIVFLTIRFAIPWNEVAWLFALLIAVLGCVVAHELGHALTARYFNVPTKDIIITPVGGLARLVMPPSRPLQELWITLAGPLTNLLIALLFGAGVLISGGDFWPLPQMTSANAFWVLLFWSNLVLFGFNLLPAYPMDGGRVLRSCLSFRMGHDKATAAARLTGQVLAVLAIFLGSYFKLVVLILIGVMVFTAARLE